MHFDTKILEIEAAMASRSEKSGCGKILLRTFLDPPSKNSPHPILHHKKMLSYFFCIVSSFDVCSVLGQTCLDQRKYRLCIISSWHGDNGSNIMHFSCQQALKKGEKKALNKLNGTLPCPKSYRG